MVVSVMAASDPPNIDQVQYSYNLFLGKTPFEQRNDLVGEPLFDLSNQDTSDDGAYIKHDQIDDMSTNAACFYEEKSNEIYWGTSTFTLERQSSSSSNGYDQQTSIGIEGSSFGVPVTAETSIRNALVFSNSQTSETQYSAQQSGYSYTFDASANRQLYAVEVDWEGIASNNWWSDNILNEISSLGSNPSTTDVFEFFRDVGTHGLQTATFGQSCTTAAFMQSGYSTTSYYQFNQDISANEVGFLWWTSSSSSSESNSQLEQYENGFRYYYGNKYCRGELDHSSSCGGGMAASGFSRPAITRWTYKPIWEMDIFGFSSAAKSKMVQVFGGIYAAGYSCRNNYCNGHGQCGTNANAWNVNSFGSTSYSQFWDESKCFCDDHYEGGSCGTKSKVIMSLSMSWSGYQNVFDSNLNYLTSDAICGINSYHDDDYEDRRFGFQTCKAEDSSFYPIDNTNTIGTTDFDASWSLYCDSDKVMGGLHSEHDNGREDRRWRIYCRKLNGLTTSGCYWTGYQNNWDAYFNKSCPTGEIIHGLHSVHNNGKEDRLFKYQCCSLIREENYKSVSRSGWGGYVNNWDSSHSTSSYSSNQVFCGVNSYHDSDKEDRRVRFRYCKPSGATLYTQTDWSDYSNWDSEFSYKCKNGYFITAWSSYHDSGKEDRRYRFRCGKYSNTDSTNENDCVWTPYVNDWDARLDYTCGDGQGLNGVESYHDNHTEDRRFKFRCCRLKVF
jgi:hypothetical protein